MEKRGLMKRLETEGIVCAEGYLFEMERRGYLTAGEFVPEVALDHPEVLANLPRDFQHAGSDVLVAFTYNAHREKMCITGKEYLLESLNRAALDIAKKVADDVPDSQEPNLVAGNISNSNIWHPSDTSTQKEVRGMFDEMVAWAANAGVDYIIGETFYYAHEAFCALEAMRAIGEFPAVITLAPMGENKMCESLHSLSTNRHMTKTGDCSLYDAQ